MLETAADPAPEAVDPRDPANLPPLGEGTKEENWAAVNKFFDALANKGKTFFEAPCNQADLNLTIFETGKSTAPCDGEVISNKIRNDINTTVNGLLREAPTKTIEAQESGEPPEMVPLMQPIQAGVDEMGFPLIQTEFPIDDMVQAKFEQKLIDRFWTDGDIDSSIEVATFNCRIAGWCVPFIEWDRQAQCPRLRTNISVRQTLIDPSVGPVRAIEDSNWDILRWRLNYWQARAMYPHLSKHLKPDEGKPSNDSVIPLGTNQENQDVGEKMVDLEFLWVRNYPAQKMTPAEAVEMGEVEAREVPNEIVAQAIAVPDPLLAGSDDAQPAPAPNLVDGQQVDNAAAGEGAQPVLASQLQPDAINSGFAGGVPQTRLAYYLPNSDTEITPASAEWPWWLAVRRFTRIGRAIAGDDASEGYDGIPFVHMVANPIPLTPCGQGDPQALQSLQEGRNRALTNAVDHSDLFAHPVQVYCASAWDVLPSKYKEQGAKISGMQVVIPDADYVRLGGKISVLEETPPISAGVGQILEILGGELVDDMQGSKAQQGKQQGEITGWQTTQMLLQQANARFDLPAKFLEKMVTRLVKQVRWMVLWQAPLSKIMRICSEYPPEVVMALIERGKQNEANVKVVVNVSSGGVQATKKAEAVQKFQLGVIGKETLTGRLGEDYAKEAPKVQADMQMQAMQQAGAAAMMPEKPGKAENGNGAAHAGANGNGRM